MAGREIAPAAKLSAMSAADSRALARSSTPAHCAERTKAVKRVCGGSRGVFESKRTET